MDKIKESIGNWVWRIAWKLLSFSVVVKFEQRNRKDVEEMYTSFLHYRPENQRFIIDWDKETIEIK